MQKWNELGIHFDAITTGFMASERQAKLVARYCREQAALGTDIYVDPVMGDYGKLYDARMVPNSESRLAMDLPIFTSNGFTLSSI